MAVTDQNHLGILCVAASGPAVYDAATARPVRSLASAHLRRRTLSRETLMGTADSSARRQSGLCAIAVWAGPGGGSVGHGRRADDRAGRPTAGCRSAQQNADLQRRLDGLQQQVDDLRRSVQQPVRDPGSADAGPSNRPAPRRRSIGSTTFQSLMLDNKPVMLPGDVTAGYKDGFYLKQGDEFSITANGVFDVRYNYTDVQNKTALKVAQLTPQRPGVAQRVQPVQRPAHPGRRSVQARPAAGVLQGDRQLRHGPGPRPGRSAASSS